MENSLSILLIEDSKTDAELLIQEFIEAQYEVTYDRVYEDRTLREQLQKKKWDIVISDYNMPQFNGLEALKIVKEYGPTIPFIFVSGTIGEDRAIEALKLGANDYILKDNLKRFIPAVQRALQEAETLQKSIALEKELKESEERYRSLVELSPDTIFILIAGKIVFINQSGLALFGATHMDQLLNRSIIECVPPEYQETVTLKIDEVSLKQESLLPLEEKILRLDGSVLDVQVIRSPFIYMKQTAIHVIMRNITIQKLMQARMKAESEITTYLVESHSFFEAYSKILKSICENLSWDVGLVFAMHENKIQCLASWQSESITENKNIDKFKKNSFTEENSLIGHTLKTKDIHWSKSITSLKKYKEAEYAECEGLCSVVALPLLFESKVVGVVELFSKTPQSQTASAQQILSNIGNQLGLFIMRKDLEGQIEYMTGHDSLTGLYNRTFFENELSGKFEEMKKQKEKFPSLLFDVDDLNVINDKIGHKGGDEILKSIAKSIVRMLPADSLVFRLGSDEFFIIMPEMNSVNDGVNLAKDIQDELLTSITFDNNIFPVFVSIGICWYPEDGTELQDLMNNAYTAMYRAKKQGKNDVQLYKPEMAVKAKKRVLLEQELRWAVDNQQFILYYQPKMDIKTGKPCGVEALLRWEKFNQIITPDHFIHVMEETGLIVPVGRWILETACFQHQKFKENGLLNLPISISVNFSARQFKEAGFLETVSENLQRYNIPPYELELELTETVLMEVKTALPLLMELKNMGVKLSIDDFGTGFSSFTYLQNFPIDCIKIDRSFIKDITPSNDAIVAGIISMGKQLGLKIIAEGVETNAQLEILSKLGCDEIQGYLYSRPLPFEAVLNFLNLRMN